MKSSLRKLLSQVIDVPTAGAFYLPELVPRHSAGANVEDLMEGDLDGLTLCAHSGIETGFDQKTGMTKITVRARYHLKFRGAPCGLE